MKRTKTPEHRAEMAARRARQAARGQRQQQRAVNQIVLRELVKRYLHDKKMT